MLFDLIMYLKKCVILYKYRVYFDGGYNENI